MTSTAKKCKATRKDGKPCEGWAGANSEYCFAHDPALAAERKAARSKGGHARHGRRITTQGSNEPAGIATVADVVDLLGRAINDTLALENSIARGRCLGYLAGVVVKALEASELEMRVTALEEKARLGK